ncbi:MAG: hypothetical protein IPP90_00205 [Gemmatimonadaceae bacterium]|nr:hypothetical protein [Gemmatimonadaceae bacterium]
MTADRLRERSRERDRLRGDSEPPVPRRDGRPGRERDGARPTRTEEQKAQKRQETRDDPRSPKREPRREPVVVAPETSTLRTPRPPRPERPARGNRPAPATADAELILDDPFAAPASRSSGAPRVVAADVPASEPHAQRDAAHDIPDRPSMSSRAPDDIDPGTENGDDDAAESANNAGDSPAVDEPQDAEGQERKRRRNRRSRRRKSRTRGESGETSVGEDDATATDAPREESRRSASPYAGEPDAEDGTDPGDDTLNDGVEGDASDEAPEDGGGSANESRSRRRGRRGRRGGSRRSRGRGRDSAAGTDAAAPSNAEPPSPPPPGSAPSE